LEYPALDKLAGEDAKMQRLIEQAKRLVNKNVNILLHGETGTGKEVIARALHDSSNRRKNTFVAVNCAAIPESLIESELFGYAAGSFTGGRTKGMRGLIQQSDGGTLFLDEIGDMPLHLQSRLLRVLSEREVLPIGGEKPIPIQLTVVAASHRDIRRLIADGVFREDLYYRLCGATLHLPPLRERGDKRYVISRVLGQEGVHMGVEASISGPAMSLLLAFEWPGNIRQLRNVIRFALAVCDDGYIDVPHLPQELGAEPQEPHFVTVMSAPVRHQRRREDSREAGFVTEMPFAQVNLVPNPALDPRVTELGAEGAQLFSVLRKHHWNITAVSSELNICRATVYRQMKRFAIVPPTHL
jgi:transcriptional regulator of acetoin/glycerol metabolism